MTMLRLRFLKIAALLFIYVATGCGGGSKKPSPTPAPKSTAAPAVTHTARPAMHIHAAQSSTTTAFSVMWNGLFPTVYAQSSITVAVQQNWEGACPNSPQAVQGTASFVSYAVFGLGQNSDAACASSFNDADGTVAAQNSEGKLVFGAGTLSNLVVSTDRGTNIVSTGGAPIKIWVQRNGAVQFTGLTCTLPAGANELLCQGTATFAALNLDRVIATITHGSGDVVRGLTVNFTKALL